MSNVATKSLILSQPKANQSETIAAPSLPHTTVTGETIIETRVEIPGVDPSTVNVNFEENALFIECEKGVLTLSIDPTVDVTKIKADIMWGMLTLSVPMPKPPAARSIKVSVHDATKKAPLQNATEN